MNRRKFIIMEKKKYMQPGMYIMLFDTEELMRTNPPSDLPSEGGGNLPAPGRRRTPVF